MALLTKEAQEKVVQLLVAEGLASAEAVKQAQAAVAKSKQPILAYLTSQGIVNDEAVTHATAVVMGVPYVNLNNIRMDQEVLLNLPKEVADRSMVVPLGELNGQLVVAMLDVSNVQATDYLSTLTRKPIKAVMASEGGIRAILAQYTGDFSSVEKAVSVSSEEQQQAAAAAASSSDVKTIAQDSPISKALTTILDYAVKAKASDIHIEPLENALVIRMRIDGVLRQIMKLEKSIEPALVSRIKILSSLKIDEHRIPQDGQFTVAVGDKEVDLRIAISPVVWGEQVVIRLLDKTGTTLDVEQMGMTGHSLKMVLDGIALVLPALVSLPRFMH